MPMSRLYRAILSVGLLLAMASVQAEEAANWDDIQVSDTFIVKYNTSIYSGHWCIQTFLSNNVNNIVSRDLNAARAGAIPMPRSAGGPFYYSDSALPYRSSLLEELKQTRFLQLMTLWRGHEKSLVLGINSKGMLGVNLDNVVALNR